MFGGQSTPICILSIELQGELKGELDQPLFALAADDGIDTKLAQIPCVERRIHAVEAQMHPRIALSYARDRARAHPQRRVHRDRDRHQARVLDQCLGERLNRQIDARGLKPCASQEPQRHRQSMRRMPQFVARDQHHAAGPVYTRPRRHFHLRSHLGRITHR